MQLFPIILSLVFLVGLKCVDSSEDFNKDIVKELVAKINAVEQNGKRLQETIENMQDTFAKRESELLERIAYLESKVLAEERKEAVTKDGNKENLRRKRDSGITKRLPAETEVAFYATASAHDNQHLGIGQDFVLDLALTNQGNAYSKTHGVFTAPVAGTYIFHATICGRDVHTNIDSHYYAYFDVDGHSAASKFIVTPYDQSSQMLVIDLQAGSQVSVRNSRADDGYVGQGYTSFSGFLLYEHDSATGVVG